MQMLVQFLYMSIWSVNHAQCVLREALESCFLSLVFDASAYVNRKMLPFFSSLCYKVSYSSTHSNASVNTVSVRVC